MDLSPGKRRAPAMFCVGRTTTVESIVSVDILLPNIAEMTRQDCDSQWRDEDRGPAANVLGRQSKIANRLYHRLRFGGSFFQNLGGNFLNRYIEFEHRRLAPAAPAAHLPVSAQELDLRMSSQVQQQRMLRLVKLLRKVRDRLRTPGCAIP